MSARAVAGWGGSASAPTARNAGVQAYALLNRSLPFMKDKSHEPAKLDERNRGLSIKWRCAGLQNRREGFDSSNLCQNWSGLRV